MKIRVGRLVREHLSAEQRRLFARTLMAHAQLVFAALVVQAIVPGSQVRGPIAAAATAIWVAVSLAALWIEGLVGEREG